MRATLPRSAVLAAWTSAWLTGESGLDDVLRVLGPQPQVIVGMPGAVGALSLVEGLGALRRAGAVRATVTLPAPGILAGLAGPPEFNRLALEHGEGVVMVGAGAGLIPVEVGAAVEWHVHEALAPPPTDPGEVGTQLRQSLLTATATLVDLDVASWQPEIADALMNLRHRPAAPLPPRTPARHREIVERASLCLDIVALAAAVPDGALTAAAAETRRVTLAGLDRAAREALVATCG